MKLNALRLTRAAALSLSIGLPFAVSAQLLPVPIWTGYGGNAQHTAQSPWTGGQLNFVQWHTAMDTDPTYNGGELLAHYGEPCVTGLGDVVIGVAHGTSGAFTVEGHEPFAGNLLWSATSHYVFPSYDWTPSFGAVLLPAVVRAGVAVGPTGSASSSAGSGYRQAGLNSGGGGGGVITVVPFSTQACWPEAGGQVAIRSNADISEATISVHAFYGDAVYAMNPTSLTSQVKICTPLTAGPDGSIYFGYYIDEPAGVHLPDGGANSVTLQTPSGPMTLTGGGLAVLRPNMTGAWTPVSALAGTDEAMTQVQYNCAPAISYDGSLVYIAISQGYAGRGYLTSSNTRTMLPNQRVSLIDPFSHTPATVDSDGTSSPMIAQDGSVYFGVLENSLGTNNFRGWMLHFSGNLATSYLPGQFGWDITPSVVPSKWISTYTGASPYLLVCKYNNYAGAGGDGLNKVAVLDPDQSDFQHNAKNGVKEMAELETLIGQTPDPAQDMAHPGAVKEWCINSIAVDVNNKIVIVNSEDGTVYGWDISSNAISYKCVLTAGLGEAYTSTAIGYGGNVYAISNATLYAVNTFAPFP